VLGIRFPLNPVATDRRISVISALSPILPPRSFLPRRHILPEHFCLHTVPRPDTEERSPSAKERSCRLLYLIAIVLPPVGLLLCGKVVQALLCFLLMLTLLGWPFASIWAVAVVANYHADRRTDRLIREMRRDRAAHR